VVEVRDDAGRFGSGYKDRPKSDASIRPVPMAEPVVTAVARRLAGCGPTELVFCGPGGSNGIPRGARSRLSIGNYRRVYRLAASRAELPDLDLHGPHDLRHTFATWLEDAGIPARVIDELMGPPGWPPWRSRRQHDRHALPAHDRGDAGARGGGHRRSAGCGAGRHAPGVPQGGNGGGAGRVRAQATGRVTCGGVGWS
jgi:Phage integrase family